MTTIVIKKTSNGEYNRITCMGHSGYADAGSDIVCAALSVLVINTINSIEELTQVQIEVNTNEETGFIDCHFVSDVSGQSQLLVDSLILGLNGIVNNYGKKYLELRFEEV